ncbi:hypothetical protein ACIBI9_53815 [Nonomuraea sp. NPDC050451]|uniref:hypothetical protein n=1 Tax=Nonomuraea sp. NPDC050451 TaxID=3364364 RepID=UPI0037AA8420
MKVVTFPTCLALEVVGPTPAPGADVQTVLRAPLSTKVRQAIGENDKTVGSRPLEYYPYGFGADLTSSEFGSLATQTEWNAAAKTTWGSIVCAYSRISASCGQTPVGPLPGAAGQIVGAKLALFGSAPHWSLQQVNLAGPPVGEPQAVKAPAPGFTPPQPSMPRWGGCTRPRSPPAHPRPSAMASLPVNCLMAWS